MIGKLKSKNVRTVRDKKVMRLQIDIPYQQTKGTAVDGQKVSSWAEKRVGELVGFDLTALENQNQETLMEVYDKL